MDNRTEWDTAYQMSLDGEAMERFVEEGWLVVLDKLVLEPLKEKAFKTFQRVDPQETVQVIQTQIMAKIIDEIRLEINRKIQQGKYAREQLRVLADLTNP